MNSPNILNAPQSSSVQPEVARCIEDIRVEIHRHCSAKERLSKIIKYLSSYHTKANSLPEIERKPISLGAVYDHDEQEKRALAKLRNEFKAVSTGEEKEMNLLNHLTNIAAKYLADTHSAWPRV